jgi:thiol-disulfide isomerase/thioredoxin
VRFVGLTAILFAALSAGAENPASALWDELKTKREKLASLHQEFNVSQTSRTSSSSQAMQRRILLDVAQGQWRETSVSGSGARIRIFDGNDLFTMEAHGDEYVRNKRQSKDEDPAPSPYGLGDPDWSKAEEVRRRPCGLAGSDHVCVVLRAPLKHWSRPSTGGRFSKLLEGTTQVVLDIETGLAISSSTAQLIDNGRRSYQSDTVCTLDRMKSGEPADATLFRLPAEMHEVKELSKWNVAKIKKQLLGQPAPGLAVIDLKGKPLTLSDFKGKTVLLDFWTTWCGPCRADGPALEKLFQKYGDKDLMIVGISVSEERDIVEKFLKEHPHSYPIALTTENEMPLPYQVGAFPTYIVINRDGTVAAAVEGDKGFGDLRKLLKKAGLDSE